MSPATGRADGAVPTVVIGDFGRDASLRFCAALARGERATIARGLPRGAAFYDEYRRIALHFVGELRFIKAPWIAAYEDGARLLDDHILVGFPGGPSIEEVVVRLGVLVLEALAGPASRGHERAIVALPCNTLAPASWELRRAFSHREGVEALVDRAGYVPPGFDRVAERLAGSGRVSFPTVPEAVLQHAGRVGAREVLPLGTPGIARVYAKAAEDCGIEATVVALEAAWQAVVLEAIQASIADDAARKAESRQALIAIANEARARWGEGMMLVEACTDLDYGVGVDSVTAYADALVRQVYGP